MFKLFIATRRRFIGGCSALAATMACVRARAATSPRDPFAAPSWSEPPSFEAFARHSLSSFVALNRRGESRPLQLVLAESSSARSLGLKRAPDSRNERFRLVFRGEGASRWAQDTYRFRHARLGEFDLFIVPIGAEDPRHGYYEAVFNRPSRLSPEETAHV